MERAILISIQPKWLEKILNGEKTLEIRKTMPKCDLPIDVYIYCTKGKFALNHYEKKRGYKDYYMSTKGWKKETEINGKVVAKFTLNNIFKTEYTVFTGNTYDDVFDFKYDISTEDLEASCLTITELEDYGGIQDLYLWMIDNLKIFDEPKDLSDFTRGNVPQSWCYVEV